MASVAYKLDGGIEASNMPAGFARALARQYASVTVSKPVPTTKAVRLDLLERRAKTGDAASQNWLGCIYYHGLGKVEVNHEAAAHWIALAAEQGFAEAHRNIGILYLTGEGVAANLEKAIEHLEAAASQDDAPAQFKLSVLYESGQGVIKDLPKAEDWLRRSASNGFLYAQTALGFHYASGLYRQADYGEAKAWLEYAARRDEPLAQCYLGLLYFEGLGTSRHFGKAFRWLYRAAKHGYSVAQWGLGDFYAKGYAVKKNPTAAFEWFLKAANQGDAEAQCAVGAAYMDGSDIERDYKKAANWLQKSADRGNAVAPFLLGCLYQYGLGVTPSATEAVAWFRRAATLGHVEAQFQLGLAYATSNGIERNASEAAHWYRLAADQEHPQAQINLGSLYAIGGDGVTKNFSEAERWFRPGAERGVALAQLYLGIVFYEGGPGLEPDDIEALRWLRKASPYYPGEANPKIESIIQSIIASANINITHVDINTDKNSGKLYNDFVKENNSTLLEDAIAWIKAENDKRNIGLSESEISRRAQEIASIISLPEKETVPPVAAPAETESVWPNTWEEAKAQVPGLMKFADAKAANPKLTIIDHLRDEQTGYGRWAHSEPGLPRKALYEIDPPAHKALYNWLAKVDQSTGQRFQLPDDIHLPSGGARETARRPREAARGTKEAARGPRPHTWKTDGDVSAEIRAARRLVRQAERQQARGG